MKTSENRRFSDVFGGVQKWNINWKWIKDNYANEIITKFGLNKNIILDINIRKNISRKIIATNGIQKKKKLAQKKKEIECLNIC